MVWATANWQLILGAGYVIVNEVIASNPNWKANSVLQVVLGVFRNILFPQAPADPKK